jgi:hypothetical protein
MHPCRLCDLISRPHVHPFTIEPLGWFGNRLGLPFLIGFDDRVGGFVLIRLAVVMFLAANRKAPLQSLVVASRPRTGHDREACDALHAPNPHACGSCDVSQASR